MWLISFVLVELTINAHVKVLIQFGKRDWEQLQMILELACGNALCRPFVVFLQAGQELSCADEVIAAPVLTEKFTDALVLHLLAELGLAQSAPTKV